MPVDSPSRLRRLSWQLAGSADRSSSGTGDSPLSERGFGPAVLWILVAAVGLTVDRVAPTWGAIVVAGIGAVLAGLLLRGRPMFLTVPAMAPIAFAGDVPPELWVGACALVALAVSHGNAVVSVHMNDMQRHMSWCRRRGERAAAVVIRMPLGVVRDPVELVSSFRVTDSVELRRESSAHELRGLLDEANLDREALELRVRALVGADARFGWATFPEDGVTIEALFGRARDRVEPKAGSGERRIGYRSRMPGRKSEKPAREGVS